MDAQKKDEPKKQDDSGTEKLKADLANPLYFLGAIGGIGSAVNLAIKAFNDVYDTFYFLISGVLVTVIAAVFVCWPRWKAATLEGVGDVRVKEERYGKKVRITALVVAAGFLAGTLIFGIWYQKELWDWVTVVPDDFAEIASPDMRPVGRGSTLRQWVSIPGGDERALVLPATIQFRLSKNLRDSLAVGGVSVKVESYDRLPERFNTTLDEVTGFYRAVEYTVDVDRRLAKYAADITKKGKVLEENGIVTIKGNESFPFAVSIDAKQEGSYTIVCEVKLERKKDTRLIRIGESIKVAKISRAGVSPERGILEPITEPAPNTKGEPAPKPKKPETEPELPLAQKKERKEPD